MLSITQTFCCKTVQVILTHILAGILFVRPMYLPKRPNLAVKFIAHRERERESRFLSCRTNYIDQNYINRQCDATPRTRRSVFCLGVVETTRIKTKKTPFGPLGSRLADAGVDPCVSYDKKIKNRFSPDHTLAVGCCRW